MHLPELWYTRRLSLRPPRLDDAEAIFGGWTTDPEVTRYLTWRPNQSVEETREFLRGCEEGWRAQARRIWVIARCDEPERPIGMIELRIDGLRGNLGYVL